MLKMTQDKQIYCLPSILD